MALVPRSGQQNGLWITRATLLSRADDVAG